MKDKIIVLLFLMILFIVPGMFFITNEKEISFYERRKLSTTNDLKEDFFGSLDKYLMDQFPFRDDLISISSSFNRYFLGNIENNDVYIVGKHIIPKNYPSDEKLIESFINKINFISNNYLKDSDVYCAVIPDKSYFLDEDKYLKINFNNIFDNVKNNGECTYIDIAQLLELDDYYYTDIHIKQDSYFQILEKMNKYMNFGYKNLSYKSNTLHNFYGASYSKVPKFMNGDTLTYLTNEYIERANVWHLEYGEKGVYDTGKLSGVDMYDVFLSGASSYIEIENDNPITDKELIIFRDSFGSSFSPLLIPFYKKISVIDLRYISFSNVVDLIDFQSKDVLFLYSTLIINNSNLLKVSIN